MLLLGSAFAQPADSNSIPFCLRCEIDGPSIYRKASTLSQFQQIGTVNQRTALHRDQLPAREVTLYISGPCTGPGQLPDYWGYAPTAVKVPLENFPIDPDGVYYIPARGLDDMGPVVLKRSPGVGAFCQRRALWCMQHAAVTGGVLLGFLSAGIFILFRIPLWREQQEFKKKQQEFHERLMAQNLDNDQFIGRVFSNYISTNRIGAGGMAVVYKGIPQDTLDEKDAVAIKVMTDAVARDPEYRRRFKREIQISNDLDNVNVVRLIGWGDERGVLYLIMEYIQGSTLRDLIPERGFLLPRALELMIHICSGMIYAHKEGVVHRDLKPENIMVTQKGIVKIMDLGLAKREESENVTKTGDTFGTPAYMAPEQIAGGKLTMQTDQYAMGVILFELLTGRRPFDVQDSLTMVMKHLNEPPPLVRTFKPQLPPEIEELVDRMLAKDPAKRLTNVAEVRTRLEKIRQTYVGSGPAKGDEKPGQPQEGRPTRIDPRKTKT